MFKLVATDLDGTLLRPDGSVSSRTRSALREVVAAGMVVVLVTGRPLRLVTEVASAAGVGGIGICANGALVVDVGTGEVIEQRPIAPAVAAGLVADLRAALPGVVFARETVSGLGCEPGYPYRGLTAETEIHRADAMELATHPSLKLLVRHDGLSVPELFDVVRRVAGPRAEATFSGVDMVEVSAAGVTKGTALAGVCARFDIDPAEVIAFGDMPNDLPMLAIAGRSVAVANAHAMVRAAADEITASNAEDGVAAVLERLPGTRSTNGSGAGHRARAVDHVQHRSEAAESEALER